MKVKRRETKIQLHEAPFFLLVIDDVQRVDDRLHSGVGAPERDHKSGYESEAELCVAFCRKARDLLVKELDRARGKNARGQRQVRVDRRGVGDQAVERDEGRNGGKNRQQRIEDDASRDSEQSIVIDAGVDAPKYVLPSSPGNMPRRHRVSSPSRLLRSTHLRGNRLIVLELLLGPPFGIDLRRGRVAGDFARLARQGIGCSARVLDRPLVLRNARSLVLFAKRRSNHDHGPISQKRP